MSFRTTRSHANNTKAIFEAEAPLATKSDFSRLPPIICYDTKPITPPQSAGTRGCYRCVVDHDHQPYSITWSNSPEYPDLKGFPDLKNVLVSSMTLSPQITAIWRSSELLDYGSYASIRVAKHDQFPVLKVAHSDELSLKLIQHEFKMLIELTKSELPVVEFDDQPILDNGAICGYRMRRLSKLEVTEFRSRFDDIKDTLDRFHAAGFSHGDFTPSNVMKDDDGHIILIDYSFAGTLGHAVPSFFPSWPYTNGLYTVDHDMTALGRYITPM